MSCEPAMINVSSPALRLVPFATPINNGFLAYGYLSKWASAWPS